MSLTNLKYINALGGIQATRADGVAIYLKPGSDDHALAEAGEWGSIAEYVAPDEPTALEIERAGMVVSRFQAKAALSAAGLLSSVETAISGADAFVQLAWAEAVEFKRNSPTIATLAAALELTDTEVDDLFRAAAVIEA